MVHTCRTWLSIFITVKSSNNYIKSTVSIATTVTGGDVRMAQGNDS